MTSELQALQRAGGVAHTPFAAAELPARFRDIQSEWTAVRRRCGLLDARFRGVLRMSGVDRTTFLQGMLTNDVAVLQAGEGTYAALLTQQGKVVSDLRLSLLADEVWLDTPVSRTAAVRENLERYIVADDVAFVADDAWTPLVALEGPQAADTLLRVAGESVQSLKPFAHRELRFDGASLHVIAASHTGEAGYLLFGRPAVAANLWERCRAAGAEPVGMEALDVLRLEAGIPWHGRDMDESTLIGEVGLKEAISYTKGCYLGQEVVERVAARGQVHRKLVGLVCDGERVPPAHAKLMRDGKEVGWITSAAWSPGRAAVIALGYAKREYWETGCEIHVALADESVAAHVEALPFL